MKWRSESKLEQRLIFDTYRLARLGLVQMSEWAGKQRIVVFFGRPNAMLDLGLDLLVVSDLVQGRLGLFNYTERQGVVEFVDELPTQVR